MPLRGMPNAPAAPALQGPWRRVVEMTGFRTFQESGTTRYLYSFRLAECGHEVERRSRKQNGCYCEVCGRAAKL